MKQDSGGVEELVRQRIRAVRMAQGLSLQDVSARANLSQSTLSRIENGQRRLALDQLVLLARALDTSVEQLVETASDDVVSNPTVDSAHGWLRWRLRSRPDLAVIRSRLTAPPPADRTRMRAHAGHEWVVVLSGVAILLLGQERYRLEANQAAEFPTMLPHAMGAEAGPCEILGLFDQEARREHQRAD